MARTVVTLSEQQKAEVETLAAVLSADQIADYFGIGRTTFFAIMHRDHEIAERYKKGKARAIGSIAQSLISKARSGDTTSMIFFLKTQAGWRETTRVEHAPGGNFPIEAIDLEKLSDQTLNELAAQFGLTDGDQPTSPAPAISHSGPRR